MYKIGMFLALNLPLKVTYWVADIAGSLYYLMARRDRKILTNNIRVVLNHNRNTHQVRRTSRMVFINFARYLVEFFHTPKIDLKYVNKNVGIEGRENLDRALRLGKGVLLVSAHLGNWELGAIVLAMLGYKINVVAWTHNDKQINDFFLRQRQSKGLKVIPLGIAMRTAFSALRNKEAVAFLGDIGYASPEAGIAVKFFGRDTIMPKGPAVFCLKTGAPIVPLFMLRERGNRFRYIVEPPIISVPSKDGEADLTSLTQKISERIETCIARYPEQWFMLTPRWEAKGKNR